MEVLTLSIFGVTTMAFAIWAAKLSMRGSLIVTPLAAFVAVSILFVNVGFLVFFIDNSSEIWAQNAILSVSLGLGCVCVGGVIGTLVINRMSHWSRIYSITLVNVSFKISFRTSVIIYILVFSYFYLVGYVPLVEGVLKLMRSGFTAGLLNTVRTNRDVYINPDAVYVPMQGLFEAIRYFALPLVCVWFIEMYRRDINRKLSAFMIVSSAFLTTMTGQRWPLMYLLGAVMIYISWRESDIRRYKKLITRTAIATAVTGITLSVLLGRAGHQGMNALELIYVGVGDLLTRIVYGNVSVPFRSYALFHESYPLLYGESWLQNMNAYIPGPGASFPVHFYEIVNGVSLGYTAPPDFYTEAYINFGWIGVVVISGLWGIFLSVVQLVISQRRSTSMFTMSFYVLSVVLLAFSSISGVSFTIGGLIVYIIVSSLIRVQVAFNKKYAHGRNYASA